jgi:hypothetical protein
MKQIITLLFILSLYACHPKNDKLNEFSSLEGEWEKIEDMDEGTITKEIWRSTKTGQWKGIGLTLENKDTIFLEHLSIIQEDDWVYYVADVSHNPEPVKFKWNEKSNPWRFENPNHDFPKFILYQTINNKMNVEIGDSIRSLSFHFEKK